MRQILPGLYYFTGLILGRVYAIEDPDGLTIIDAGLPGMAGRILRQLGEQGYAPDDVKRILITHAHPDHIGGLPELQRQTGAPVMCHPLEKPVIEGEQPMLRLDPAARGGVWRYALLPDITAVPAPVARTIEEGDILTEVMGGLHVIATPGHAPGHLAFWQPEKRVLFGGDMISHTWGTRLPPPYFTADVFANRRSVGKIATLNPEVYCFGHGRPLMTDAAGVIQRFARRISDVEIRF